MMCVIVFTISEWQESCSALLFLCASIKTSVLVSRFCLFSDGSELSYISCVSHLISVVFVMLIECIKTVPTKRCIIAMYDFWRKEWDQYFYLLVLPRRLLCFINVNSLAHYTAFKHI
jgi:hypothetical protein